MKKPYQIKVIYFGDDSGKEINKDFEMVLFNKLREIGYKPTGGSGFNFQTNSRDLEFQFSKNIREKQEKFEIERVDGKVDDFAEGWNKAIK